MPPKTLPTGAPMAFANGAVSPPDRAGRISGKIRKLGLRLRSLKLRHANVEASISAELRRPRPDDLLLQRLKKLRLRLKDEITGLDDVLAFVNRLRRTRPAYP